MDAALRFAAALLAGACGGMLFWWLRTPLPWVLGSMTACAISSVGGLPLRASSSMRKPMAAVIGVMLGSSFHPDLFAQAQAWIVPLALLPIFLVNAALICVFYFRRVAGFDAATAFFSGMPGGIAEMVLMGAERGADERAIGLIHAARIFLVVFILPFLIRLFHGPIPLASGSVAVEAGDTADWTLLLWGGGCIAIGLTLGRMFRLPAWHLIGPLFVSAAVHASGLTDFRIPAWALAAAQVGLGATIGCRFMGLSLPMLARILGIAAGSTAIMLTLTFLWAFGISWATGIDATLLILAYSPGGVAEMSMVALSLALEPGFVIIHHLVRVVFVLIGTPLLYRMNERTP
ncbi:MAG: AbrB family transcriptional regulator [Sphingobium sp.]